MVEMTKEQESELLLTIEAFGREAIDIFFKEGVDMGLFKPEDHDIIMETLKQKAELNLIKQLQEHFDDHHKDGTKCEDMAILEERFELVTDNDGKITVVSRKLDKTGMN